MKIAVLGWNPRASDSAWQPDGPFLPIEFVKTSRSRLIPVLCDATWARDVRTLWFAPSIDDFEKVCHDLAAIEDVSDQEIGYIRISANGDILSKKLTSLTFTVEPSIRVPDKFGNRVEDVVLVTEAGGVSLYNADRKLNIIA